MNDSKLEKEQAAMRERVAKPQHGKRDTEDRKKAKELMRQFTDPSVRTHWLAHERTAKLLEKRGAKVLVCGKGMPDLLFEINGRVFAAEVKGPGDRLSKCQEAAFEALKRMERVYIIREFGKKFHPEELTLDEVLDNILEKDVR
jgi:hypothetical protein